MLFKKLLIASMGALVSMNVFAWTSVVIYVTPQMFANKAGVALPWEISKRINDFDIENETNASINVTVALTQAIESSHVEFGITGGSCQAVCKRPPNYIFLI